MSSLRPGTHSWDADKENGFRMLKSSSVKHLRTLADLTKDVEDLSIPDLTDAAEEVVGLSGRKRLQKDDDASYSNRGAWMDKKRHHLQAYEYLCRIGEAKQWIESCINEEIPPIVGLEDELRNGVILAKLARFRHSDNINRFFKFLQKVEMPDIFTFELTDLYEKKNIPKVIYCIHALSFLLHQDGVAPGIQKLVGKLDFTEDEIRCTQSKLDAAGLTLPNFKGLGDSFVGEEIVVEKESDEDRIQRQLLEEIHGIVRLQSHLRGSLLRNCISGILSSLQMWEGKSRFAATLNGAIIRLNYSSILTVMDGIKIIRTSLQAMSKGLLVRKAIDLRKYELLSRSTKFIALQASARGHLIRRAEYLRCSTFEQITKDIKALQGAIRGYILRQKLGTTRDVAISSYLDISNHIRGWLLRKALQRIQQDLRSNTLRISKMTAHVRGVTARDSFQRKGHSMTAMAFFSIELQALVRGRNLRNDIHKLQSDCFNTSKAVRKLQSVMRGRQIRLAMQQGSQTLLKCTMQFIALQKYARAFQIRRQLKELGRYQAAYCTKTIQLQTASRALLARRAFHFKKVSLASEQEFTLILQTDARGFLARKMFKNKLQYFKRNMEKIVKIQSIVRARQQGEAYKSLTSGHNPPVGTIKNFVHLLNDNNFDFEGEIELERLRKEVMQRLRANEQAEQYIDQLDIKIALLVKNKITLDEIVKSSGSHSTRMNALLRDPTSHDPFNLKGLNKSSRRKLDLYQVVFFMLQARPKYLARLFRRTKQAGFAEKEMKNLESFTLTLFGYARKRREEYLLLKLVSSSIHEEICHMSSSQEFLRGSFLWMKLLNHYSR